MARFPRRRKASAIEWVAGVAFVSVVLRVVSHGWTLFFVVLGILLAFAWYARVWSARSHRSGVLWSASVNLPRYMLAHPASRFTELRLAPQWRSWLIMGHVGGKLILNQDGVTWLCRRWMSFGVRTASGRIQLPWSEIDSVDIQRAVGKIPGLGGVIVITLADGWVLAGEFLGSAPALRAALAQRHVRGRDTPGDVEPG
jgi:uncharacterized protein (DUF486 family)